MKDHILFITSTNLASNPRCRKEINLALASNYKVTYIAFDLPNWTKEKEKHIQNDLAGVEKIYVSAGREKLINWVISTSLEVFLRKVYKCISATSLVSYAISRRSLQLIWALKKLKVKPDLVIVHNPPAFYPAYYYSKKYNIPFAIDIEDYHPGEGNNNVISNLTIQLIKKILPFANYVSFAAPLIKEKITSDVLPHKIANTFIINNVFPDSEFLKPSKITASGKIQLVWFSQNIDKDRGLEEILPVIESLKDKFEITLIGNIRQEFYNNHLQGKPFIHIVSSLSQTDLNSKLCEFDIGLAIDTASADENRNICLTNKIWSYFQAGLFIIASDTSAQVSFIYKFNQHGTIIELFDKEKLQKEMINVYEQWDKLSLQKLERFENGKAYSWEIESVKLKMKWKEIVQN
ncbi:hypothetical protein [Segetibacter koreensis]|uniref:hypothetical protein n=1 Tax=Segetibacter koreensis TaxID=398037 RepID=UPI0003618A56|nr:hypothetical protein [Segetibacter koreensis]